jgi:hypothetical protein
MEFLHYVGGACIIILKVVDFLIFFYEELSTLCFFLPNHASFDIVGVIILSKSQSMRT